MFSKALESASSSAASFAASIKRRSTVSSEESSLPTSTASAVPADVGASVATVQAIALDPKNEHQCKLCGEVLIFVSSV